MKRSLFALLASCLLACGGAPFSDNADRMTDSAMVDGNTSPEVDSGSMADSGSDAGSQGDASEAQAPTPDAATGQDAQVDTGMVDAGTTVADSGMSANDSATTDAGNGACLIVDGSLTASDCTWPNTICCNSVVTPNVHTCVPWNQMGGCGR